MDREAVTRGIILSVVDRTLRELEKDPERTVRKMVDLGDEFVKGRFQSYFFDMVQTMLTDEDSAYYDLVRRTAAEVDREALKTFGVNLGYESCTLGARIIRSREAVCGYNIPWAVMFRLGRCARPLEMGEYDRLVREGVELGVRAYIFYAQDAGADVEGALELAGRFPACAFLLALPAALVDDETVSRLCERNNVMVAVASEDAAFPEAAERLHRARRLYGCHLRYDSGADAAGVLDGSWARRAADAGCLFAFCHAGENCPDEVCDAVDAAVKQLRKKQPEAVIASNYYTDHLFVDGVISGTACFVGVRSDGAITHCDGRRETPAGVNVASPEESGSDIVYIPVEIVGENGVVESNADRCLTVTVTGGELLGFGSANPCTEETYHTGTFTTYYGRALAIVRAGKNTQITVTDGRETKTAAIHGKNWRK